MVLASSEKHPPAAQVFPACRRQVVDPWDSTQPDPGEFLSFFSGFSTIFRGIFRVFQGISTNF